MSAESEPWLQLIDEQESNLWYSRFLLFRDMGPARTMIGSVHLDQEASKRPRDKWSKQSPGAWRDAALKFRWKQRAEAWDEYRRKEVFTQGYAYDLRRIKSLDELAEKLHKRVLESLLTMKPRKGGFPDFEISRYLEVLDALAQETGGRVKKKEISGPAGAPLEVLLYMPEQDPEDDLPQLDLPQLIDVDESETEWPAQEQ